MKFCLCVVRKSLLNCALRGFWRYRFPPRLGGSAVALPTNALRPQIHLGRTRTVGNPARDADRGGRTRPCVSPERRNRRSGEPLLDQLMRPGVEKRERVGGS